MDRITLRCAEDGDIPFISRLHDEPHVRRFLSAPTAEEVRKASTRTDLGQFIVQEHEMPAGLVLVGYPHDWLTEIRHFAIMSPGRGLGFQALKLVLRLAFVEKGAHRACVEVTSDNQRARTLYERSGFVLEGTFREGYYNNDTGKYQDLCAYGMLSHEFRARSQ